MLKWPTEEQVRNVIRELNCGDAYDAKERADETTRDVMALFPTPTEAKATAWDEGFEAGCDWYDEVDRRDPLTPKPDNPYRPEPEPTLRRRP